MHDNLYLPGFNLIFSSCVSVGSALICYCDGDCPDHAANGTCVAPPNSYCFVAMSEVPSSDNTKEVEYTYGCLPSHERGHMQVLQLTKVDLWMESASP